MEALPAEEAPTVFNFERMKCLAFHPGAFELELARSNGQIPATGHWQLRPGETRAIIVPRKAVQAPGPPPGVSPGGMQAHYTVSYGVQFFTDGDVGHVQDEDGNEHLECGNLRVIIRRATPPPPPVEIPFEHDNFGIIPWRVHIPAALAAEFSPPAARGHRGPGRIALDVAAARFIVITELGHRHPPERVRYG